MTLRPRSTGVLLLALLSAGISLANDGYFDSNGVRIHFVDEGRGTPVLLNHGFTGDVERTWRQRGIIDRLVAAGYRVIAFDNRAHGKSDKPIEPDRYGLEMVEDARRLLDHLQIERAHVVGYSMGARLTNKFRELYPDRLLTVTLGGYGWPRSPTERTEADIEASLRSQGRLESLDPKALAVMRSRYDEFELSEDELRRNTVPALALIGADDPRLPAARSLVTIMGNVELRVVPGNHGTALAQPEFLEALLDFLNKHSGR